MAQGQGMEQKLLRIQREFPVWVNAGSITQSTVDKYSIAIRPDWQAALAMDLACFPGSTATGWRIVVASDRDFAGRWPPCCSAITL